MLTLTNLHDEVLLFYNNHCISPCMFTIYACMTSSLSFDNT
jgi:hypothetical protein